MDKLAFKENFYVEEQEDSQKPKKWRFGIYSGQNQERMELVKSKQSKRTELGANQEGSHPQINLMVALTIENVLETLMTIKTKAKAQVK